MRKGWREVKLAEVTFKIGSGSTPRGGKKAYKASGLSLIRSLNVYDSYFRYENLAKIGEEQADKLANVSVEAGDVLLNITGASIARCCVVPDNVLPARVNQHVAILRPNSETLYSGYLEYLLISKEHKDRLLNLGDKGGSTRQALTKSQLQNYKISIPSLSEQKRIVAILDEAFAGIDAAIANTEKNLANAWELFESYLNSVFDQSPDHWVEDQLKNVCSIKHGFAFKSEFFAKDGNYVVLTPGSFWEAGGFRNQGKKTKYYEGEIPAGYVLKENDFLVVMTEQAKGLLGSSLIVPESDRFLHNQRLGLMQAQGSMPWNNGFFFHQFNSRPFRRAVQSTASGLKVRHTSPKKLGEIRIKYPPTEQEQADIAFFLDELLIETRRMESIFEQKLFALRSLKQSLLQKAFSGELKENVADKEIDEAVA